MKSYDEMRTEARLTAAQLAELRRLEAKPRLSRRESAALKRLRRKARGGWRRKQ